MIKATRQQSANVLLLDAGNALWSTQPLAVQSQGKVMIEGMNLMGYSAAVIGDLDLQLGPEVLRQRMAEAKFPILSANVLLAGENKLLAQPYALLEMEGRKVGIIGLTWDAADLSLPQIQGKFTLLRAEDVLARYAAELAKQADIIIVLSNMGYDEDVRLSSLVPGIDLIVGGRSRIPMPQSWRNNQTGTLVVQAGSQGEWIGRRVLRLDSAGIVTNYADELIYLTDDFADDAEMRAFLDNYRVQ
ncbi:MAG: bifunctional metallophosphatase/5'-nucleotidase [Anaerolineae bacterium]